MARVNLSNLSVDYEQLVQQFNDDLKSRNVWSDAYASGIGQTFIEWLAATGAYEQYAIQRSFEEAFSDTARQDNSQILIARMLGVHIQRRSPAAITCTLTGPANYVIPAYSQFVLNSTTYLFNRTAITLPVNSNSVTLYEGQVINEDVLSVGGPYQRYYIGTQNSNVISDLDFFATINLATTSAVLFSNTHEGLWRYGPLDTVFYENTLPDGTIEVLFGNGVYCVAPPVNNTITFTYVQTNGDQGNTVASGQTVALLNTVGGVTIGGTSTSGLINGLAAKDAAFYKNFGSDLYTSGKRMVTRSDFRAVALTYTDQSVVDIIFAGQAETHPGDLTWSCMVQYTYLSNTTITPTFNRAAFEAWMAERCIFQTNFYYLAPYVVSTPIDVTLYCRSGANLDTVIATVQAAIVSFFQPKQGTLNYSVYKSDLYGAIVSSSADVTYLTINKPTTDLVLVPITGQPVGTAYYVAIAKLPDGVTNNVTVTAQYATRTVR